MQTATESFYHTQEFAARAGVTVRALHHYDRLGVLKPSRRSRSGYRLYAERDFVRLQQIVTLKFIGFSLSEIKRLLGRKPQDVKQALALQRQAMSRKREHIDHAIRAIERAERSLANEDQPGTDIFLKIIEVINMQNDIKWIEKYYSEEARNELAARRQSISPETIRQAERDWAALIKEVEQAIDSGEDPAGDKAQQLAARWRTLLHGFTGGNAEIQAGLNKVYSDQANWPDSFQKPFSDQVCGFIGQAVSASKK